MLGKNPLIPYHLCPPSSVGYLVEWKLEKLWMALAAENVLSSNQRKWDCIRENSTTRGVDCKVCWTHGISDYKPLHLHLHLHLQSGIMYKLLLSGAKSNEYYCILRHAQSIFFSTSICLLSLWEYWYYRRYLSTSRHECITDNFEWVLSFYTLHS